MSKIMLRVDLTEERDGVVGIRLTTIEQAKSDAEAEIDRIKREVELSSFEYCEDGLDTIMQMWDVLVSPKNQIESHIKILRKHIKQIKAKIGE